MLGRSKFFYKSLRKAMVVMAVCTTVFGVLRLYTTKTLLDLSDLDYVSYADVMDMAVVDLTIIKCWRSSCSVPSGYTKIFPALDHNSHTFFHYYLASKSLPLDIATRVLVDLDFGPPAKIDLARDPNIESQTVGPYRITKTYIPTTPLEGKLPADVEAIRNLEVLFGSSDFTDSRPYYTSLHYTKNDNIHPVVSILRISTNDGQDLRHYLEEFETLRNDMVLPITSSKFKVLQISDLHFGQAIGKIQSDGAISSDLKTIRFVENSLDEETPDLVVITGDLADFDRSVDFKSVLIKALHPILSRNIKFVFTFGDELQNSPHKGSASTSETAARIVSFLGTLPNCYNTNKDWGSLSHGSTNYNVKVTRNGQVAAHVTLLDSESQKLDNSQMNYLYRINSSPDVNPIYKLLFFHYPLPQFRPVGKFQIVGSYNEKHPLNSKTDVKFLDDIINSGYQVVGVGHEHENDACILSTPSSDKKIWLCYNSATGDSANTRLNTQYVRKLRFYEIDFEKSAMLSWKRDEASKKGFDYQAIYPIK